jgi:hypothetical protein
MIDIEIDKILLMGYIKEPLDVDLVIAPSVVTEEDFAAISAAIADYKAAKNKKQKTAS